MSLPIPPQSSINTVVLGTITINYAPTWDGAAWVIDPADITVNGTGHATNDGVEVTVSSALVPFADLPQGAKDAIQQLAGFMETEMQSNYS